MSSDSPSIQCSAPLPLAAYPQHGLPPPYSVSVHYGGLPASFPPPPEGWLEQLPPRFTETSFNELPPPPYHEVALPAPKPTTTTTQLDHQ